MSIERLCGGLACAAFLLAATLPAQAANLPQVTVALTGEAKLVFDPFTATCKPPDVLPDINPRAFRDGHGNVVFLALHSTNRAFHGPDLSHLKLDCHIVLGSGDDPDPVHYNDRNFIAATWTDDGRTVAALVHHEYHADDFGRCKVNDPLGCWYNTIVAYRSSDGGETFTKAKPLVVASAPFPQDVGQGRHRGFFNPSNIFSDGHYEYFFAATTGWDGQSYGACLFRSRTPLDSGSWRAYDGRGFTIRYADPYRQVMKEVNPCAPITPFAFPVGAVVRVGSRHLWIAVFEAQHDAQTFPVDGFYYATSADLLHWSLPQLLRAGATMASDLCKAANIASYPSILSDDSTGRNFDNVGNGAYLYYTAIATDKCQTGPRFLMRQKLAIAPRTAP